MNEEAAGAEKLAPTEENQREMREAIGGRTETAVPVARYYDRAAGAELDAAPVAIVWTRRPWERLLVGPRRGDDKTEPNGTGGHGHWDKDIGRGWTGRGGSCAACARLGG